jgi:hypothetical protein
MVRPPPPCRDRQAHLSPRIIGSWRCPVHRHADERRLLKVSVLLPMVDEPQRAKLDGDEDDDDAGERDREHHRKGFQRGTRPARRPRL